MKNYTITVNGVAYDVTVEENGSVSAPAAPAAPAARAAAPAPKAAPKKVGDAVKAGDAVIIEESMKMEIPMVAPKDGTIASIDCAVGDAVEAGTVLATLN